MLNPTQLSLFGEPEIQNQKHKDQPNARLLNHFAVIEPASTQQSAVVWGVGRNRQTAFDDALTHLTDFLGNDIDDAEDMAIAIHNGNLFVLPCSKKLFKDVCTYGGEIEFIQENNTAFLPGEMI